METHDGIHRIAVGGSAANPPHLGHLMLLNYLMTCRKFDLIIWIPCGSRNDKDIDVHPDHRVAMTELLIPKEWRLRDPKLLIRYTDVYGENIPSIYHLEAVQEQYPTSAVKWYTGSDSNVKEWERGDEIIEKYGVFTIPRKGYCKYSDLEVAVELPDISSSEIRNRVANMKPFEHLVTPEIAAYIKHNHLYTK